MVIDLGIGLLGYHGSWDHAALAEAHGFRTAGFVDSPLLGGDPFVALGLAAAATSRIRLGTFLAVPGNRSAATTAAAIATVNRLAPGRTFLGLGTGFTSRSVFGRRPVTPADFARFAAECTALLAGEEVQPRDGLDGGPYRFRQEPGRYIATVPPVPVYLGAEGPRALQAVGRTGAGWISSLRFSSMMSNSDEVFAGSVAAIEAAATNAGRSWGDAYTMLSTGISLLRDGESLTSDRVLELVGPLAMLAFHSYADDPSIGEHLPPAIRDRLPVYEREVLARFPDDARRRHQWTHNGHLSFLLPGEAEVLTDDIIRMTTMTGSPTEVHGVLARLQEAGLKNVSAWVPPQLTEQTIVELSRSLLGAPASGLAQAPAPAWSV